MITKEQLTGIKVKLGNKEDWDYLSNLCKSLGLEQATWSGCDFNVNSTAFVSGWEGRFLATRYWEDGYDTAPEFRNLEALSIEDIKLMEKNVITNKEQLNRTFIRNEGKLADKWLGVLGKFSVDYPEYYYLVYTGDHDRIDYMEEHSMSGVLGYQWLIDNGYREVTLEDFKEEGEEEMETKDIDWSQAPEGYDYWIIYDETVQGTFYKNSVRYGYPAFEDRKGLFVFEDSEDLVIYKRPEPVIEEMAEGKKIIQKYIREEFNTRGQALDSYDSGVVFYTPSNNGYLVVDETGILEHFGQLFTLEEREETWQDVAQEFIKDDPVLSEDKFVEDIFGDDFTEYHEPMRQLAKLIVESSGD